MKIALKDQDTSHGQTIPEPGPPEANSREGSRPDKQIPVLDGVRAIACLSVLSLHLSLQAGRQDILKPLHDIHDMSGMLAYFAASLAYAGDSGVILFFVLSGFLLFLPYAKALLFDDPWPSLRRFYLRRIFRILPGYYVALFLMILFFHPAFLHASYWHIVWLFLTFRMGTELSEHLNGVFWTLAVEFQFYLLLPIIAWLFRLIVHRGTLHRRLLKLAFCLLGMVAWGLLTRYWGLYIADTPKLDFLIPHTVSMTFLPLIYGDPEQFHFIYGDPAHFLNQGKYFEVFAIGMLISTVYTHTRYSVSAKHWNIRICRLSPLMFTTGLALLSFLFFWYFYIADTDPVFFPRHPRVHVVFAFFNPHIPTTVLHHWAEWQALGYAISYGFCMLALLYGSPRLKRLFESSPLRWVASISFSLYLWHSSFLSLFAGISLVNMQRLGWSPLVEYAAFWCWTLLVIIPISAMLYRWVEQPGIRLGERLIGKFAR